MALRVEALHGIVDLAEAEFFQLPVRTPLPQPSPFTGAVVARGEVALELAVGTLGFAPLAPALDLVEPPADLGLAADRELRFARAGRTYALPLSLVVQVIDGPRLAPVPLTPASHRGLLYHGRALHPVFDLAAWYGALVAGPGPHGAPGGRRRRRHRDRGRPGAGGRGGRGGRDPPALGCALRALIRGAGRPRRPRPRDVPRRGLARRARIARKLLQILTFEEARR